MQQNINNFLNYLKIEKGYSEYTLKNYSSRLQSFMNHAGPSLPRNFLISDYRRVLAARLQLESQNAHLITLRSFFKYLTKQKLIDFDWEIDLIKQPERKIKLLTKPQLKRLLERPKITKIKGLRDRTIMELLFATGLRVSELAGLNIEDINFKLGQFNVRGKGGKIRMVFLSERALKILKNYLKKRNDNCFAVFIKQKGQGSKDLRLGVRSIEKIVQGYAKLAGLTGKITPHTLRHVFACDLLEGGADLRSIQEMLGHSNLATTQVYTHVTNPQLRETYQKFHAKGDEL